MRLDAAPQSPLGGDADRIGRDLERRDAEPVEMLAPGGRVREMLVRMLVQSCDDRAGQVPSAHVAERRSIDDVVGMAGPQQVEEIEPALRLRGAEPGEMLVADLRADAIGGFVASPGIVDRNPGRARE